MATGDQADFLVRLKAVLPEGWFPDETPVLDAVLSGPAYAWSWVWSLTTYAYQQTRLLTATEAFLDILAVDFFGTSISRRDGETDETFRARLKRTLLKPKATRAAIVAAVTDITGNVPTVVEPANPADCGGYGSVSVSGGGGVAYGLAGAYGSLNLPFQMFVTVSRPVGTGIPAVSGYSSPAAGYGSVGTPAVGYGPLEYASLDQVRGVSDDDIYASIAAVQPAATMVWTRITNPAPTIGDQIDTDFYLDRSTL